MKALTPEQVATLTEIQKHRHEVAHELPKLLVDPDFQVKMELLGAATEIIRVLGVFWGSIEVDTNPDFDGREVDYDGIKSMSFMLMEYLTSIAAVDLSVGTEPDSAAS